MSDCKHERFDSDEDNNGYCLHCGDTFFTIVRDQQERISTLEEGCRAFIADIDEKDTRIAALEKVAEAATEWFGPSLQDARFETVAIIKALREAGYTYTTQEESK